MKKVLNILAAFPFCIPFAFIFFAVDYYLTDEWAWLKIVTAVFFAALSFTYASLGKEKEMRICNYIGIAISIAVSCSVWNGIDQISFCENHSLSFSGYLGLLMLIQFNLPMFVVCVVKIIEKIKNKKI